MYGKDIEFESMRHSDEIMMTKVLMKILEIRHIELAPFIAMILLCLHIQTNSEFEIVLYADQINILHLHNQSVLTWNY